MSRHVQLKVDTGLEVYFCDPHSPWQRGTNENTNGLLRQYFPKGTDLSAHSVYDLAAVAAALNARPRKILGWKHPPRSWTSSYNRRKQDVLRRQVESAVTRLKLVKRQGYGRAKLDLLRTRPVRAA